MENKVFDLSKERLPIGSVVSVRFNTHKFMIIGFCTLEGKTKKMYDYSAVVYPFGLVNFDSVTMFNKEIIKKIHHLGYSDEAHKELNIKIDEAVKKHNENNGGETNE